MNNLLWFYQITGVIYEVLSNHKDYISTSKTIGTKFEFSLNQRDQIYNLITKKKKVVFKK